MIPARTPAAPHRPRPGPHGGSPPAARAAPRPPDGATPPPRHRQSAAGSAHASWRKGAAAGDLDRVLQRLGQVGEEGAISCGGLEVMLRRQAAARGLLVDIGAVGDAQERVMRLVQSPISGNARHSSPPAAGPWHRPSPQGPARSPLGLGPALGRMALQLHIEAARIDPRQPRISACALGICPARINRPTGPSGPPVRQISPAPWAPDPPGHLRQLPARAR
jgi:hypothetical protein